MTLDVTLDPGSSSVPPVVYQLPSLNTYILLRIGLRSHLKTQNATHHKYLNIVMT